MEVVVIYLISRSIIIRKFLFLDVFFVDIFMLVVFEREREMIVCEYRNFDIDCLGIGFWGILLFI